MTPEYLQSRFVSQNDVTLYRLRNSENKFHSPVPIEKALLQGCYVVVQPYT